MSLKAEWLTGVAALCQIVATVFAIYAIYQARSNIHLARDAFRSEFVPEWFRKSVKTVPLAPPLHEAHTLIALQNVGRGYAAQVEVTYKSHSGPPLDIHCWGTGNAKSGVKEVNSQQQLEIECRWDTTQVYEGTIRIGCVSLYNLHLAKQYNIRCNSKDERERAIQVEDWVLVERRGNMQVVKQPKEKRQLKW